MLGKVKMFVRGAELAGLVTFEDCIASRWCYESDLILACHYVLGWTRIKHINFGTDGKKMVQS